jgi:hypothetical protein
MGDAAARRWSDAAAGIIPASPPRKQLNDPLLTITGAVTGFEGFEGGERGMHSQCYSP